MSCDTEGTTVQSVMKRVTGSNSSQVDAVRGVLKEATSCVRRALIRALEKKELPYGISALTLRELSADDTMHALLLVAAQANTADYDAYAAWVMRGILHTVAPATDFTRSDLQAPYAAMYRVIHDHEWWSGGSETVRAEQTAPGDIVRGACGCVAVRRRGRWGAFLALNSHADCYKHTTPHINFSEPVTVCRRVPRSIEKSPSAKEVNQALRTIRNPSDAAQRRAALTTLRGAMGSGIARIYGERAVRFEPHRIGAQLCQIENSADMLDAILFNNADTFHAVLDVVCTAEAFLKESLALSEHTQQAAWHSRVRKHFGWLDQAQHIGPTLNSREQKVEFVALNLSYETKPQFLAVVQEQGQNDAEFPLDVARKVIAYGSHAYVPEWVQHLLHASPPSKSRQRLVATLNRVHPEADWANL